MAVSGRSGRTFAALALVAGLVVALKLTACAKHASSVATPMTAHRVASSLHVEPNTELLDARPMGVPVRASRAWLDALAPNSRGGWNFITQTYEYKTTNPTELFVVDLQTGKSTRTEGPPGVYARTQIQSEARAANGRIFFPTVDDFLFYYDPADETVHDLGRVVDPPGDNKSIFRLVFGPDGKLYGGTQSSTLPTVFQLDPDTLKSRVIGRVGQNRLSYSFAYYLAADPPWLYVAVGENPWELVAINIDTGAQNVLATRADQGFMQFTPRKDGVTATLIDGLHTPREKREIVWCVDGKTYPYDPKVQAASLPFKPRDTRPSVAPLVDPPELNTSAVNPDANGKGRIYWRPAHSKEAWHEVTFDAKYTSEVDLESLVALPDGTLFGNATQYHGFFRFDPAKDAMTYYGPHGPSRGPRTVVNGLVYITGYPNGILYVYDPNKPWTSNTLAETDPAVRNDLNPRKLGNFAQAGAHYAYFLVPSASGRLFYAGRRERDGIGSGVGFYDPKTGTFGGHHDNLSFFDPEGLAVLDSIHRVVFSGVVHDDPAQPGQTPEEAPLIVYDENLAEQERLIVKPGVRDTGELFTTRDGGAVVVGVVHGQNPAKKAKINIPGAPGALYRYDVAAKKLLAWKDLAGTVVATTQREDDGSIWMVVGDTLERVDPVTLDAMPVGRIERGDQASSLAWRDHDLYFTVGPQIRKISFP